MVMCLSANDRVAIFGTRAQVDLARALHCVGVYSSAKDGDLTRLKSLEPKKFAALH